jgi:D-alanine transaminase
MRTAYVNGRYRAVSDPAITPQDRGFQFADGVYAVGGRMIDAEQHLDRLDRSLREI